MTITTPEGHEFVLYEDQAVTIDLFSSLFITDGELKGSYSYAGKAPLLPNRRAIDYADMLEKHTSGSLENIQVRLGNIYWTQVNMKYKVVNSRDIEFSLTLNLSLINERLKNTLLSDIPFPSFHLGDTVAEVENSMMAAAINTDYRQIPYTFGSVWNSNFGGGVIDQDSTIVNESDFLINRMRVEDDVLRFNAPNRLTDTGHLKYIAVPYFYLVEILGGVIDWLGFQRGGEVFSDEEITKMVLYNINSARISTIGLSFVDQDFATGMYISASDHVPEISIAEFLKGLSGLGIYPVLRANTNELLLKLKRNVSRFRRVDWSDKVTNIKNIESSLYGGFNLQYEDEAAEYRFEIVKDKITIGLGENKEEVKFSSLPNTLVFRGRTSIRRMPYDDNPGNVMDPNFMNLSNYTVANEKKKIPVLLLYNNGLDENNTSYTAPLHLSYFNAVTERELILASEKGIYNTYLKEYLELTAGAKEIEVDLVLNNNDLSNWRDDDIVIIKSTSGASISCLFRQLSFDVRRNSPIVKVRARGIVLNSTRLKTLPAGKLFLKAEYDNVHQEINGDYTERKADLKLSLFEDVFCNIPYTGSEDIAVDFIVQSKIIDRDYNTEEQSRGIRVKISGGVLVYPITLSSSLLEDVATGSVITTNNVEVQESPKFNVL